GRARTAERRGHTEARRHGETSSPCLFACRAVNRQIGGM
ncbi:MAG: hypothetical protein AVDCRST_MAG68-423, partial [uncultured Gemmatimonadetes bacterium]